MFCCTHNTHRYCNCTRTYCGSRFGQCKRPLMEQQYIYNKNIQHYKYYINKYEQYKQVTTISYVRIKIWNQIFESKVYETHKI